MGFKDFILIPTLLAPGLAAVLMGLNGGGWWYALVWGIFYPIFGFCEYMSSKTRGKTISKDIALLPNPIFWSIIGSWWILTIGLSLHWYLMR